MKKYTYTCDRCGADIPEGGRYRMQLADPEDLKKHVYLFEAKYEVDLCTHCAAQLMEYALGSAESDAEKAEEEKTDIVQQEPEESADGQQDGTADGQQDKSADVQQAGRRRGRPPVIDHGKVMALHDAGWTNKEIGAEMQLTEKQVRNAVDYEFKKRTECAE